MKLSFKNGRTYVSVNGKTMSAKLAVVKFPQFASAIIKYTSIAKKFTNMDKVIDYSKRLIYLNKKPLSYRNHVFLMSYLQGVHVDEQTKKIKSIIVPNFDLPNLVVKSTKKFNNFRSTVYTLGEDVNLKIDVSLSPTNAEQNKKTAKLTLQTQKPDDLVVSYVADIDETFPYKQPGYISKLLKEENLDLTELKVNSILEYYSEEKSNSLGLFTKGFITVK